MLFAVVTLSVIALGPLNSTCAAVCCEPSGWFGTHDTAAWLPVATTVGAVTFGASGGVMVVTEFDFTHAEASEPRFA